MPPGSMSLLRSASKRPVEPRAAAKAAAKRVAERVLWARVGVGLRRTPPDRRERPRTEPVTAVLDSAAARDAAVAEVRRLRLPLHVDKPKNWEAVGALAAVLDTVGRDEPVLDAGSARYSIMLPWLRLYGYTHLSGINLEFGRPVRRQGVRFEYGDATDTGLPSGSLAALTCLSVIEHGVPLRPFLSECARVLRPGGLLVVTTDYDQVPPDTTGKLAYGVPVHVFSPQEIRDLVRQADGLGLRLVGDLALEHAERPVRWARQGLEYTFIRLGFRRD